MKKTSKILILIITILGIASISGGVILLQKPTIKNEEEEQKEPLGTDSNLSPEEFYNWETNLNEKALKIFNSVYTSAAFDFTKYSEYKITLEDLRVHHNQDFSEFNTETITCNLQNSVITVVEDKEMGGPCITLKLDCTNSEEQKES